ncbi:MAG: NAD(P)-dependent oxidoreductase [Magnetococcales bacterium]|nr:NAD(P)-dependent oxidoreductase [Magnetococcales bacterium]
MSNAQFGVLITGAGGFVGRRLVQRFLEAGWRVVSCYRRSPERFLADQGEIPIVGDLADCALSPPIPIDFVIHAAARSPQPGAGPEAFFRNNVIATQRLIQFAQRHGCPPILYLSSLSIFGKIDRDIVDETTPRVNPDPYGSSKYMGECLLDEHAREMPSLALRLPGILGPGARTPWLAQVVHRLRCHEPVTLFHPQARFNNAVHVDGLADFILGLTNQKWTGFDAVTLGARDSLTIRDVVTRLAEWTASQSPIEVVPATQTAFTISSQRAETLYHYAPQSIEDILQRYARETKP